MEIKTTDKNWLLPIVKLCYYYNAADLDVTISLIYIKSIKP